MMFAQRLSLPRIRGAGVLFSPSVSPCGIETCFKKCGLLFHVFSRSSFDSPSVTFLRSK
jgi:hypothetical protein